MWKYPYQLFLLCSQHQKTNHFLSLEQTLAGTSNSLFLIISLFSVVDHWDLLDLNQKRICIPQLEIGVCSKEGCQFEHEFTHVEVEGAIKEFWDFKTTLISINRGGRKFCKGGGFKKKLSETLHLLERWELETVQDYLIEFDMIWNHVQSVQGQTIIFQFALTDASSGNQHFFTK